MVCSPETWSHLVSPALSSACRSGLPPLPASTGLPSSWALLCSRPQALLFLRGHRCRRLRSLLHLTRSSLCSSHPRCRPGICLSLSEGLLGLTCVSLTPWCRWGCLGSRVAPTWGMLSPPPHSSTPLQPEPKTQSLREKAARHPVCMRCGWHAKAGGRGLVPGTSRASWGPVVGWASPRGAVSLLLIPVCGPDPNPAGQTHSASIFPGSQGTEGPSVISQNWQGCPLSLHTRRWHLVKLPLVCCPLQESWDSPPPGGGPRVSTNRGHQLRGAVSWPCRVRTLFFVFQVFLDTTVPRGPLEMRAGMMMEVLSQVGGPQLYRSCIRGSGCSLEPPGALFCVMCLGVPSSSC